jgi:type IV secretory pathway VirB3-like protein
MTEAEQQLIAYLEHDQLVADKTRPVARAGLTRRASVGLWLLRVFVVLVSAMVTYTFISQLQ